MVLGQTTLAFNPTITVLRLISVIFSSTYHFFVTFTYVLSLSLPLYAAFSVSSLCHVLLYYRYPLYVYVLLSYRYPLYVCVLLYYRHTLYVYVLLYYRYTLYVYVLLYYRFPLYVYVLLYYRYPLYMSMYCYIIDILSLSQTVYEAVTVPA